MNSRPKRQSDPHAYSANARKHSSAGSSGTESGLARVLALSLVVLPAFALGGRYAWGQLAIVLLVIGWAAAWLTSRDPSGRLELQFSWSYLLILAGVALAFLQLAPLDPETRNALSPRISKLLPLWTFEPVESGGAGLGPWQYLSLTPSRTADALAILFCFGAVWFLAVQQFQTLHDVRTLLAVVFGGGVVLAVFGLTQWVFWDGRFFWAFDVPGVPTDRFLHGPFTNRNHFAGFLALAVGPACYWVVEQARCRTGPPSAAGDPSRPGQFQIPWEVRLLGSVVGLAVLVGTILLSLSRGGAIVAVLALLAAGSGLAVTLPDARKKLAALGLVCLFVVGSMSFVQIPALSQRLGSLAQGAVEPGTVPGRLQLWQALVQAAADFPIFGTGFGSHHYVYPLYMTPPAGTVFTHAENCYLQLWVEGGLVALNLVVAALCLVGYWLHRAIRFGTSSVQSMAIAIGSSMLATAVHAFVDFVWYVPAYTVAVLLLGACAYRLSRLGAAAEPRRSSVVALPGFVRWVGVPALAAVSYFAVTHFANKSAAELAWFDYLRRLAATEQRTERDSPAERTARIRLLKCCLAARPHDAEAHFKLAQLYASQAAESPERQRDGLVAQAGEHLRSTIQQCPLFGEAYLALAKCNATSRGFGDRLTATQRGARVGAVATALPVAAALPVGSRSNEDDSAVAAALAAQAIRVRAYQPQICFEAGYELFRHQRPAAALAAWRLAAPCGPDWERRVIELVAPHADPTTIVRHLHPSARALVWAADQCKQSTRDTDKSRRLLELAKVRLENNVSEHADADDLLLLRDVCRRLGDDPAADQAMKR